MYQAGKTVPMLSTILAHGILHKHLCLRISAKGLK